MQFDGITDKKEVSDFGRVKLRVKYGWDCPWKNLSLEKKVVDQRQ